METIKADIFEINGICYSKCEGGVEVTNLYKQYYDGDIVIPEEIKYSGKTYKVVSIGDNAFEECDITSVVIPKNVTIIGRYSFSGCQKLSSVVIPNNVLKIGDVAFAGCKNLENVELGKKVSSIGIFAFEGCEKLSEIKFPDNDISFGMRAFFDCKSLRKITIGSGIKYFGSLCFGQCISLETLDIPDNVIGITEGAFYDCKNLRDVKIGKNVSFIGHQAFERCNIKKIFIPKSVIDIDATSFNYNNLEEITVDSNNRVYDSRDNCNAIIRTKQKTLVVGGVNTIIPNNVVTIGENAFCGYDGLQTITIPESVQKIENQAFYNCAGLKIIICLPATPPVCDKYTFHNVDKQNCILQVPNESLNTYIRSEFWKDFLHTEATSILTTHYNSDMKYEMYFDLNGIPHHQSQKGINIIKLNNGKTIKIYAK